MIQVRFYSFQKKINSTERPSSTAGTPYNCTLLSGCGVVSPQIVLQGSNNSFSPATFNYAYIPAFSRYYYVTEWTYDSGLWSAAMTVDVLASWRDYINNTRQYVDRGSAYYNNKITDSAYPALPDAVVVRNSAETSVFLGTDGVVVASFASVNVSQSASPATTIASYVFTVSEWRRFFSQISTTDVWDNLRNFFTGNPLDCFTSIKWYPVDYSRINITETTGDFRIGAITVASDVRRKVFYDIAPIEITTAIPVNRHPQAATYPYLNRPPYTRRQLVWLPVGVIELDASAIDSEVYLTVLVDIRAGSMIYKITSDVGHLITGVADCGVDINVNSVSINAGAVTSAALNVATGLASGNLATTVTGVISAIDSIKPQYTLTGGSPSFMRYQDDFPWIRSEFLKISDTAATVIGFPVCKNVVISAEDLPFLIINNPVIKAPATEMEIERIYSAMKGGFYLE